MKIKKNDCVQIEYVARIKSNNNIFDLTDEKVAKENNLHNKTATYGPKLICIGRNHLLPGIEKQLEGKEENTELKIEISYKEAFGPRQKQLIKTIPTSQLTSQKINPFPGLQINASGMTGTIKSVSRGRTLIDFNHPLAGRDLIYEIKILKIIKEPNKIIKGLANALLNIPEKEIEIKKKEKDTDINIKKNLPEQIKKQFIKEVKEILKQINIK